MAEMSFVGGRHGSAESLESTSHKASVLQSILSGDGGAL